VGHTVIGKKMWSELSESRSSMRPRGKSKEDPEMCHSLIGADGRTHSKIIAVAVASAAGLVMLGGAAFRAPPEGRAAHAQNAILVAGKPALSAAAAAPIIR